MNQINDIIELLRPAESTANGKFPVQGLGFVSCANRVHIRHVPFYEPCLITVLSGRKVMFEDGAPMIAEAGCTLAVPGPASFDLRNEPGSPNQRYRALVIPFGCEDLARLAKAHDLAHAPEQGQIGILKFDRDPLLLASIRHYLDSSGDGRLQAHRLMEILLILAGKDARLLSYALQQQRWSQRVRVILATDLARAWEIEEICARLATTESTLRRNLKKENAGFRDLLHELRLSTALMQLLQSALPVYQVAYDCGYQSVSRFSSNFHKRFGLSPSEFRESVHESEQPLTVSGQPA